MRLGADRLPIDRFVEHRYGALEVQRIVDGWRVEPKVVIAKLIDHFRDMGIFVVEAQSEATIFSSLLDALRNSPEIRRLVSQARREEARKVNSRHAG